MKYARAELLSGLRPELRSREAAEFIQALSDGAVVAIQFTVPQDVDTAWLRRNQK